MLFYRWLWYHYLVFVDTFRRLRLLSLHVCIVAGICLPILILRGINRGHVADLRHSLETSPVGRQVTFWSAQRGPILDDHLLEKLHREIAGVEIIIPELTTLVGISTRDGKASLEAITLRSTASGDPILKQLGVDVVQEGERALVLSESAAQRLGVRAGDTAKITLYREGEEHHIEVIVKAILKRDTPQNSSTATAKGPEEPSPWEGDNVGFMDYRTINIIDQYKRGYAVPEWALPASRRLQAPDEYESYLVFCKISDQLRDDDIKTLHETFDGVERVEDPVLAGLYGIVRADSQSELVVYRLFSHTSPGHNKRFHVLPSEINKKTYPDEVILAWNSPRTANLDGKQYQLVGLSFEDPSWLRRHLLDRKAAFDYSAKEFSVLFPHSSDLASRSSVTLLLEDGQRVELQVVTLPEPQKTNTALQGSDVPPTSAGSSQQEIPPSSGNHAQPGPPHNHGDSKSEPSQSPGQVPQPGETDDKRAESDSPPNNDQTPNTAEPAMKPTPGSQKDNQNATPAQESGSAAEAPGQSATIPPSPSNDEETTNKNNATTEPALTLPSAESAETNVAVVPTHLLAHLHALSQGTAIFDAQSKKFVPKSEKPRYDKARLYAKTIDEVPAVVTALRTMLFVPKSEEDRILEIKKEAMALDILVFIVGAVIFVFGLATVATVLWDSTNRKRKDIGILRIMGTSGAAVLYMVLLRAFIIGVLSTVVSFAVAYMACSFLSVRAPPSSVPLWLSTWLTHMFQWKASLNLTAHAFLDLNEDWIVALVALGCSFLGAIVPGLLASRLDPFDAVVHAKDS